MSVQAVNQLLGPGSIYVKKTTDSDGKYKLIGSVKEATFSYTKEEVEAKPGDMTVATRRDKVEEKASLKFKVVDFRLDQMIDAFGLSASLTQLTLTSSIRIFQEISFGSTTDTKTLSRTMKSLTALPCARVYATTSTGTQVRLRVTATVFDTVATVIGPSGQTWVNDDANELGAEGWQLAEIHQGRIAVFTREKA